MLGHSPTSLECPFHRWRNRVGGLWGVIQIHDGHYCPKQGAGEGGQSSTALQVQDVRKGQGQQMRDPNLNLLLLSPVPM